MGIPHAPKPRNEFDGAGGAYVRRRFIFGERELVFGDELTAEELATIPRANLIALVNTGKLELWPAAPGTAPIAAFIAERFAVNLGFGRWTVIEGRKLVAEPITKQQAEALAAGQQEQAS